MIQQFSMLMEKDDKISGNLVLVNYRRLYLM